MTKNTNIRESLSLILMLNNNESIQCPVQRNSASKKVCENDDSLSSLQVQ